MRVNGVCHAHALVEQVPIVALLERVLVLVADIDLENRRLHLAREVFRSAQIFIVRNCYLITLVVEVGDDVVLFLSLGSSNVLEVLNDKVVE